MTSKIVDLTGQPATPPEKAPEPSRYIIKMRNEGLEIPVEGFLALNGHFVCILGAPNDPLSVTFYALADDVLYVIEDEEVPEE